MTELRDRFLDFHEANPHVYEQLVQLARSARAGGRRRIGIGELFEELRWEDRLATGGDSFKLNNSHRAFYARLIARQESDLSDLFEFRRQRGEPPHDALENRNQLRLEISNAGAAS